MDTFFSVFFFVIQISGICYLAWVALKSADEASRARWKQLGAEQCRDIWKRGFDNVAEMALAQEKKYKGENEQLRAFLATARKEKAVLEERMREDEEHHQHLHRQLEAISSGKLKFKKRK